MKKLIVLTLLAVLPVAIFAAEPRTELGKHMKEIGGAYKALSRALRTPETADAAALIAHVHTLKEHSEKSLALIPEFAAEQPAEKRDAFIAAYQADMKKFLAELTNLEAALAANDLATAATITASLKVHKDDGHEKYQKPE